MRTTHSPLYLPPSLSHTAPMQTMYSIKASRSTGDLSPLPYISLFANCVVWSLYGLLNADMTVLLPNLSKYRYKHRTYT